MSPTPRILQRNYIVKFDLAPRHITNPPISRTLSCPAEANFYQLHRVLQLVFGWSDSHLYEFEASRRPSPEMRAITREFYMNSMNGQGPPPALPRYTRLRLIDQEDDFSEFVSPTLKERRASGYKLQKYFDDPLYADYKMVYTYDEGDSWEHEMTVLGRADPTNHFVCLAGTGHPAAEDVRGPVGWEALKAAYRAARPDDEQLWMRTWFEKICLNGEPLGLSGSNIDEWPQESINEELEALQILRNFHR